MNISSSFSVTLISALVISTLSSNALGQEQSNQSSQWVNAAGSGASQDSPEKQPQSTQSNRYNGVRDMAPLPPPSQLQDAKKMVSPLAPNDIRELNSYYNETRAAMASSVQGKPEIRSTSVHLSPGSDIPMVQTMKQELTAITFIDSTGAPWPLQLPPRVSRPDLFDVNWVKDTNIITVMPKTDYQKTNMTVILEGMSVPLTIGIKTLDPETVNSSAQIAYDYRHDMRVPGRGPKAQSPTTGENQIALYDQTLQNILDGLPPESAVSVDVAPTSANAEAWLLDNKLFIRTSMPIRSAFEQTLSSADGTHVYKLPPTPFVAFSSSGRTITLKLDF